MTHGKLTPMIMKVMATLDKPFGESALPKIGELIIEKYSLFTGISVSWSQNTE